MKRFLFIAVSVLSILVAGHPVKSSLSARHAQYGGGSSEVWVNPYITEGLIGMWDGKWNVGGGVHDDMAMTWADLSGNGRDAVLSGTFSWGENCWKVESVSGRGLATWPASDLGEDQTIEFVIQAHNRTDFGRVIAEGKAVASPILRVGGLYMYGYGIDHGATVGSSYDVYVRHLHQIVHPSGGPLYYYIDGILMWTAAYATGNSTGAKVGYFANRSSYDRGIDADYYTMRMYDRVLSDEELAFHYAIDKERFDLP